MSRYDSLRAHPSRLSGRAIDVLAEAYKECNGGVLWIRLGDMYVISSGTVSRTGRMLTEVGFLRPRPGAVAYLPGVAGAGKRAGDPPAQVMEITPDGTDALRRRMGADSFAQLSQIRREYFERLDRTGAGR